MKETDYEFELKLFLRTERDRLKEIERVVPEECSEAHRLIETRLKTIRESLEG